MLNTITNDYDYHGQKIHSLSFVLKKDVIYLYKYFLELFFIGTASTQYFKLNVFNYITIFFSKK